MQDFPANSQKAKETEAPRETLKPVTSAETVRRKRGLGRQFKETFFAGTARDALGFMIEDVVVPAIRDTLHDAMQGGLERIIYGERTSTRPRRSSQLMTHAPGRVDYSSISSSQPKAAQQTSLSRRSRARHEFADIVIESRADAQEVIDQMFEQLSRFGFVTVADLHALVDIRPDHTDLKWGWTNLRGAKAVRLRTGDYLLDLPDPEPV
jgi:hypothetical protein